jgi:hypothetical protein
MSFTTDIYLGDVENDGKGDSLRDGGQTINDNFNQNVVQEKKMQRTMPAAVNSYVEVGDFARFGHTAILNMSINVSASNVSIGKTYRIILTRDINNDWQTVQADDYYRYTGGADDDFELDLKFSTASDRYYLRLRRTSGTNPFNLDISFVNRTGVLFALNETIVTGTTTPPSKNLPSTIIKPKNYKYINSIADLPDIDGGKRYFEPNTIYDFNQNLIVDAVTWKLGVNTVIQYATILWSSAIGSNNGIEFAESSEGQSENTIQDCSIKFVYDTPSVPSSGYLFNVAEYNGTLRLSRVRAEINNGAGFLNVAAAVPPYTFVVCNITACIGSSPFAAGLAGVIHVIGSDVILNNVRIFGFFDGMYFEDNPNGLFINSIQSALATNLVTGTTHMYISGTIAQVIITNYYCTPNPLDYVFDIDDELDFESFAVSNSPINLGAGGSVDRIFAPGSLTQKTLNFKATGNVNIPDSTISAQLVASGAGVHLLQASNQWVFGVIGAGSEIETTVIERIEILEPTTKGHFKYLDPERATVTVSAIVNAEISDGPPGDLLLLSSLGVVRNTLDCTIIFDDIDNPLGDNIILEAGTARQNNDIIFFVETTGTLPTGLSTNQIYYVIDVDVANGFFRVSNTKEGPAIDFTDDGVPPNCYETYVILFDDTGPLGDNIIIEPNTSRTNDDIISFYETTGTLPTGLYKDQMYYVIDVDVINGFFRVSNTEGGPAIDFTGDGVPPNNYNLAEVVGATGRATVPINTPADLNPCALVEINAGDIIVPLLSLESDGPDREITLYRLYMRVAK